MDSIYLVSLTVSVIFLIVKFFETRFILKETLEIKRLIIDTVIVYFSVLVGYFIINQFDDKIKNLSQAPVFVDTPKF
tara:strand:+ start:88 stop:318 length:231 start_codon:yes stop_codon:yes gene_type:complete